MRLKEGEIYQSKMSDFYYEVVKINKKSNQVHLRDVHCRIKIELPLEYANEILKPVPKLKKILLLEL